MVWVGAINAILFAVLLALLRFVHLAARPRIEVLGRVKGHAGLHSIDRHAEARTTPGIVLFRFNGPLVFFNSAYFKREALAAARAAGPGLNWFVLDLIPVTQFDVTGMDALDALEAELAAKGVTLVSAGRMTESTDWLRARGLHRDPHGERHFPTMRQALRAYKSRFPDNSTPDT